MAMGQLIDLTDRQFGRWTVLYRAENAAPRIACWHCRCRCGTELPVRAGNLLSGASLSCGCLNEELSTTHGQSKTRTYRIWIGMRQRCENENRDWYRRYGGRGILVCRRWAVYENFLADMGECPPRLTLERNNNDGNYEPDNCRWATRKEQAQNLSTNRYLIYQGRTQTVTQWAEEIGLNPTTVAVRLFRYPDWPIEKILSRPRHIA